eukprot:TRINITY_DN57554_c0_g1_i1.p1 TRINITY_DN57554_c0_g1~~TRINITY_DN57554_c0_g1_i1.p1  ORF type:complete len:224 (-),score=16.46 TRINITY_DN57554_c0_g1_i1:95-766(-)
MAEASKKRPGGLVIDPAAPPAPPPAVEPPPRATTSMVPRAEPLDDRVRVQWDEKNLTENADYFRRNPVQQHIDEPPTPFNREFRPEDDDDDEPVPGAVAAASGGVSSGCGRTVGSAKAVGAPAASTDVRTSASSAVSGAGDDEDDEDVPPKPFGGAGSSRTHVPDPPASWRFSKCSSCKVAPVQFETHPCRHRAFCEACARRVATGGRCTICKNFFARLQRID